MLGGAGGAPGQPARPPAGTMESPSSLRGHLFPGDRLVVKFPGDPGYGHERVVLWPAFADDVGANEWVILTERGDVYNEGFWIGLEQ